MGLQEPFSSISHMAAGGLAAVGLVLLVFLADGPLATVGAVVYGAGLMVAYTLSAVYHAVPGGPRTRSWLQRLDHVAIYLLIAGTYTPVCLVLLGGGWGWSLFGTVWGLALLGMVLKLTVPVGPKWIHLVAYIGLGWIALVAAPVLFSRLDAIGLAWLVGGGVVYTLGALVYAWDRPMFGRLHAHDVWHLFVVAGSAAHFVFIAAYVL